jgi:hypothetical protein
MKRYATGGLVAIAATTIGLSVAPLATADPSCQTVGMSTLCGQSNVSKAKGSATSPGGSGAAAKVSTPAETGGGCTNSYGTYQRC